MSFLQRWLDRIPAQCPACERRVAGQGLCSFCHETLLPVHGRQECIVCRHPLIGGVCPDCSRHEPLFDGLVAAFDYAGTGMRLIQEFKHRRRLALGSVLAGLLLESFERNGSRHWQGIDWVTAVPARASSLQLRGFSPPAEIARLLAQRMRLPYRLDLVCRAADGPRQARLRRSERLSAPYGRFRACGGYSLSGTRVAVVDDVLTTGATMNELARVLKEAGAKEVHAWVLGRTIRHETP